MKLITKLFAEELVRDALVESGILMSHVTLEELHEAAKDLVAKLDDADKEAHRWYNRLVRHVG